ncbi:unnamed protein product [Cladocopium goreaui]|uniref:Uncharacterized protein C24H6.11c n=1 Tax=Cladocopium goreaui TaxID=2562237 RepID=A0A9P1GBE5_9DINO|nr:unnamed protein product [Cladocopium goreaui]
MKAFMYLLDLILTRYVRKLKSGKDDAALEKVAKGCIGENGRSLALILLAYVDYKMTFTKNWMECKDYIKELAYKWESCGFFRSPVIKKVVCEILRDVGADDHMRPETELPKQKTRPLGEIMVPKLPHIERDQRHFYEHLLWDKEDRQGRYDAFLRGMHADTEKERERAKAMEKRRCDRLGRKPRPPDEIEELKEELRQELETGVEKLRARMVGIRPLGQKRVPYATEFSQLARFFPEPEERMSGGVPFADRALLRNSFKEPAQSPAAQEPTEKPASARVSGTKKAAVAAEPAKSPAAQEPTEKPASARVSGTKKAAVAAEPAKSPAAQEPTEKPASARVSGTKKAAVAAEPAKSPAAQEPAEKPASARVSGTKKAAVAAEPAKSPAAQEPTEKPASARVSGTKKAAVAAEPAKSPAAQEPTEKPASARVSGTKKAAVAAELAKSSAAQEPTEKPASARVSGTKKAAVAAELAKSPAAQEPTEKPASARVSGTKKAAVAAEPAKSPAAQEPTEKPASGRVSGRLRGVKRPRPEPAAPAEESQKRGKSDDEKSAKDPSAPPSPAPENQPRKIKWKGGSLHVWPVLGDHRCLFRAVVRGLFDPYNTVPRDSRGEPLAKVAAAIETRHADLVRKALCDHMQLNKALVEPSIERPGDATKYIQSMRSPTTWADQICTKFLPDVIKCPIHVQAWNREKKRLYDVGLHLPSQGTDEKRGTIFLYYNGRTHYELVSQQQIFKRRSMEHETVSSASSGSSSIEKTSDLRADKKV